MMGMVFTELLEMVEKQFSFDMVDAVVHRAGARGSYTSVGNYDDAELVALVSALSVETGVAIPDLLHAYGGYLFGRFFTLFPQYFSPHRDAPSFLEVLESHVHTEVRKLYAEARPPLFTWEASGDGGGFLEYRSSRGLARFAHGLLEACLVQFGAQHRIGSAEDLSEGASQHVRFHIVPA